MCAAPLLVGGYRVARSRAVKVKEVPVRAVSRRPTTRANFRLGVPAGVALLLLGSCSRLPEITSSAEQVVAEFEKAVTGQQWEQACGLLAPGTVDEIEQNAKDDCSKALPDEKLPEAGGLRSIQVWGRASQVVLARDSIFLTTVDGKWKITAAGCKNQGGMPYQCSVKGG